jgi:hypothetical protein
MEIAKMLDDWDARTQKDCMNRARTARDIVDVQGIDSDQHGALFFQINRGPFRQE